MSDFETVVRQIKAYRPKRGVPSLFTFIQDAPVSHFTNARLARVGADGIVVEMLPAYHYSERRMEMLREIRGHKIVAISLVNTKHSVLSMPSHAVIELAHEGQNVIVVLRHSRYVTELLELIWGWEWADDGRVRLRASGGVNLDLKQLERFVYASNLIKTLRDIGEVLGFRRQLWRPSPPEDVIGRAADIFTHLWAVRGKIPQFEALQVSGVKRNVSALQPQFEALATDCPGAYALWATVLRSAQNTYKGVRGSTVLNPFLEKMKSTDDLQDAALEIFLPALLREPYAFHSNSIAKHVLPHLGAWRTKRKQVLSRKTEKAFKSRLSELDSLNISSEEYPLLWAAIHDGDIPLSVFFRRKEEQYFLLNDNWPLWEAALERWPKTVSAIAENAARRSTYEKNIMSLFYFCLYDLPAFLETHTGQAWACAPRLVDSVASLTPGGNERTSLTPQVDNEAHRVVVPYAHLAVAGRNTNYCYSLSYNILRRGFTYRGNTVMHNTQRLNGRDDYGLFFYTLTGSVRQRGYPTFLVIFERRTDTTYVHFHRTHPMRSKNGDPNPVHNWLTSAYQWMAGNIRATAIAAQQGDLIFVRTTQDVVGEPVTDYDSHTFDTPVTFALHDEANILGYIKTPDNILRHPEHEDTQIDAGVYEVRQCRSWEANPRGVWSLRID